MSKRHFLFSAIATFIYLAVYILYFSGKAILHPATMITSPNADSLLFAWMFKWWAYAFTHHLNPLFSNAIFYPFGLSLLNVTSIPLFAIPFIPLTLATNAFVSYNIALLVSILLTALASFLLSYHLVKRFWIALLAGYLFSFSSYMVNQTHLGHINLCFLALILLAVWMTLSWIERPFGKKLFIVLATLLVILQFFISKELLLSSIVFGSLSFGLAYWFLEMHRTALKQIILLWVIALVVSSIMLSPLIIIFLHYSKTADYFGSAIYHPGLFGWILPPFFNILAGLPYIPHGALHEFGSSSYLGIPLVAIIIWFHCQFSHSHHGRFLLSGFLVTALLVMGTQLIILNFNTHIPLPWDMVSSLPLLKILLPERFMVFANIYLLCMTSLWLKASTTKPILRWLLVSLAALWLLPTFNPHFRQMSKHLVTPPLIANNSYQHLIPKDSNVYVASNIPTDYHGLFLTPGLQYQTQTNFWFHMPFTYIGFLPKKERQLFSKILSNQFNKISFKVFLNVLINRYHTQYVLVSQKTYQRTQFYRRIPGVDTQKGGMVLIKLPHTYNADATLSAP